jgi:dUTP pyrophosphatase
MELNIELLDGAKMPVRATAGAAGYDLYANESVVIRPGETVKIKTGICLGLPDGYWAKIFDRSSVGSKGLLVNAGVIDQNYIGEVIVCMTNLSNGSEDDTYLINTCDKIAQFVLMRHYHKDITTVDSLYTTERGDKGFGSSGA